jgi:large subunit ribosomal protein L21
MYAIIRTGGHQEKVAVGEQITVDRLKEEPGAEIRFVPLMVHKDDGTIVTDHAELEKAAIVVGKVVQHFRGEKLEVFNYRQKTGYRRHTGHRQPLTLVDIEELRLGNAVERAEDKRAADAAARVALELQKSAQEEEKKSAPKKVTPKKTAPAKTATGKAPAGKAASAKKPAAKKPAAKKPAPKKEG